MHDCSVKPAEAAGHQNVRFAPVIATFNARPVARMMTNMTRMAKSDGIIAISRAGPLRNTSRNALKMMSTVSRNDWVSVGTRL